MKVGDLVLHEGVPWKVTKLDRSRVCTLLNWARITTELPDDCDVPIVCNPATDWPFVAVKVKTHQGPIIRVSRDGEVLKPLVAWVPSNILRAGGSVFFNPQLNLKQGQVLVAEHERGSLTRISITSTFGTVARRLARQRVEEAPEPQSAFERLMGPDLYEE